MRSLSLHNLYVKLKLQHCLYTLILLHNLKHKMYYYTTYNMYRIFIIFIIRVMYWNHCLKTSDNKYHFFIETFFVYFILSLKGTEYPGGLLKEHSP